MQNFICCPARKDAGSRLASSAAGDVLSGCWRTAGSVALCLVAGLVSTLVHAIEVTDDRGLVLRLAQPAQRIITLTPHLTELVFAAGAGGHLAGVARFSDYPPEARQLPVISDAAQFDIERMLVLKPDLVLAWQGGTPPETVARLERIGLPVYVSGAARLEQIAGTIEAIAILAGTQSASAVLRTDFNSRLRTLRMRRYQSPPVRVFYEIWPRPLMTVSNAHIISEIIGLCGGENVFGTLPSLTPEVSREALLAARPEVALGGSSAESAAQFAARWAALPPPLNAVPAYQIPPDLIQRPTLRLLDGAQRVCTVLDAVRARRQGKRE